MLKENLPGQKLSWKEGFIGPHASPKKDQALGRAAYSSHSGAEGSEERAHRPGPAGLLHGGVWQRKMQVVWRASTLPAGGGGRRRGGSLLPGQVRWPRRVLPSAWLRAAVWDGPANAGCPGLRGAALPSRWEPRSHLEAGSVSVSRSGMRAGFCRFRPAPFTDEPPSSLSPTCQPAVTEFRTS